MNYNCKTQINSNYVLKNKKKYGILYIVVHKIKQQS